MTTKTGQIVSTLLMIGLTLFWSASILAAEPDSSVLDSDADAAEQSVALAADATKEAAADAAKSIAEDISVASRVELELNVISLNVVQVVAN